MTRSNFTPPSFIFSSTPWRAALFAGNFIRDYGFVPLFFVITTESIWEVGQCFRPIFCKVNYLHCRANFEYHFDVGDKPEFAINWCFLDLHRRSHLEVFCKKDVLRNFAKFTGKHLCQSLCLRPANLFKKRLWHRCVLVNFAKFLGTPFLQNNSGGCFCLQIVCKNVWNLSEIVLAWYILQRWWCFVPARNSISL